MTHDQNPNAGKVRHPLQNIAEWRKGCSCAIGGHPSQCEACTDGLVAAIEEWFEQPAAPAESSVFKSALDEWFEKTEWLRKTITPQELGKHYADVLRERIEKLENENAELKAAKLPQQEGADYFVVLNNDGDVEFAYNAQLGRDFGHDHIKNCQERDIPVSGWVVRPAFATQPAAQGMDALTPAARDVLAERQRQISAEGWTPAHDDEHGDGSMGTAAACYALANVTSARPGALSPSYLAAWVGWGNGWFKPGSHRRNLEKAGALILAEIERIDRAALAAQAKQGGA